jgi:hypothetical protein
MAKGVPRAKAIVVNKPILMTRTGSKTASLNKNPFFELIHLTFADMYLVIIITFDISIFNW